MTEPFEGLDMLILDDGDQPAQVLYRCLAHSTQLNEAGM